MWKKFKFRCYGKAKLLCYSTDHCMVNFIKRNLLGSLKEFRNRFINPIQNGQCADSTPRDVRIMKKRAHVLHNLLARCVQVKGLLLLVNEPLSIWRHITASKNLFFLFFLREKIIQSWHNFYLLNTSTCWQWEFPHFSVSCTAITSTTSLVRIFLHELMWELWN